MFKNTLCSGLYHVALATHKRNLQYAQLNFYHSYIPGYIGAYLKQYKPVLTKLVQAKHMACYCKAKGTTKCYSCYQQHMWL